MSDQRKSAAWVLLLMPGILLNTMGITLTTLGPGRFAFNVLGLGLLLAAVLVAMKNVDRGEGERR
jgi:glucose dehydrogenase